MLITVHTWEGIDFKEPATAGEIFEATLLLAREDCRVDLARTSVFAWVAELCEMEISKLDKIIESKEDGLLDLVLAIVKAAKCQPALDGLRHLYDLSTGGDAYKQESICKCGVCSGGEAIEGVGCIFENVTPLARVMSDWSYLMEHPEYYDRPLFVMEHARLLERSRSRGDGARRQAREANSKEAKSRDDLFAKHGYTRGK